MGFNKEAAVKLTQDTLVPVGVALILGAAAVSVAFSFGGYGQRMTELEVYRAESKARLENLESWKSDANADLKYLTNAMTRVEQALGTYPRSRPAAEPSER